MVECSLAMSCSSRACCRFSTLIRALLLARSRDTHFVVDPKSIKMGEPSSATIMLLVSAWSSRNLRWLDVSVSVRDELASGFRAKLLVAVKDDLFITTRHQGHGVASVPVERGGRWLRGIGQRLIWRGHWDGWQAVVVHCSYTAVS